MNRRTATALAILLSAVSLTVVSLAAPAGSRQGPDLLEGSWHLEQDGWLFVHLEGTPFQVGYQNGYHAAESADHWLTRYVGAGGISPAERVTVRALWPLIPEEYQQEIDGIVAGLRAQGHTGWDRWDVVAANAWADLGTYEGGCSAFIASGDATTEGQIVAGHVTMAGKARDFMYYVMFDVAPDSGHRFRYQGAGGCIWSGEDWYLNDAGLIVTETSLGNRTRDPGGSPLFVRIRKAVQYADDLDDFISVMTTDNNGAYPNEWLVGNTRTGEILSLMLGCHAWDINRTFDGVYPSANYAWYPNFRQEAGLEVPAPDPPSSRRAVRWLELIDRYYGRIDIEVGKRFLEDDIISSYGPLRTGGGYDGKVTSTALMQAGMHMWARWGNPAGKAFDLDGYLAARSPEWIASRQETITALRRYVDRTPQPWTCLTDGKDGRNGVRPAP